MVHPARLDLDLDQMLLVWVDTPQGLPRRYSRQLEEGIDQKKDQEFSCDLRRSNPNLNWMMMKMTRRSKGRGPE